MIRKRSRRIRTRWRPTWAAARRQGYLRRQLGKAVPGRPARQNFRHRGISRLPRQSDAPLTKRSRSPAPGSRSLHLNARVGLGQRLRRHTNQNGLSGRRCIIPTITGHSRLCSLIDGSKRTRRQRSGWIPNIGTRSILGVAVSPGLHEMIVLTDATSWRVSDDSSKWHAASCEAVIVRSGGGVVSHRDGRQCGQRAANAQPNADVAT